MMVEAGKKIESDDPPTPPKDLGKVVGRKEARKILARRSRDKNVWFGLGMFGMVGWSVAVPTLIGVAVGIWVDSRYPSNYSWTLMLLFIGLIIGCLNAWYWVKKEGGFD